MLYQCLAMEDKGAGEIMAQVRCDAESPWYDGHFINDPILPGVAQLHMVSDLLQQSLADGSFPGSFQRVKFKKIARPGELLDIHLTPGNKDNQFVFSITSGADLVCSGKVVTHNQHGNGGGI